MKILNRTINQIVTRTISVMYVLGLNAYADSIVYKNIHIPEEIIIYTPNEMLSFNIENYFEKNSPHLLPYAEIISHWSGYTSISPKIIITLIEQQTKLISTNQFSNELLQKPLSTLSTQSGFSAQVRDVASQIATRYYQLQKSKNEATSKTIHIESEESNISVNTHFIQKYQQLFPKTNRESKIQISMGAVPPVNQFQLPYHINNAWYIGGTHNTSGGDYPPYSSLDMYIGGGWGTDTSNIWVVAASEGTVVKHSSCSVEVISSNGWSTSYYHLDNIQYNTNDSITENAHLANYADNESQALCQGGFSTGPHVHFSLKNNGRYSDLNGVKLSGFTVHTGRYSYDTDCNYFWLLYADGERKYCANSYRLSNPGIPAGNPDLIIQNVSLNDDMFTLGQTMTIDSIVLNQGTETAEASTLRYYLSTDATISTSDSELGIDTVDVLVPGDVSTESISLTAPALGSYWIGTCVDTVAGESNTGNNCSLGMLINVSERAEINYVLPAIMTYTLF